MNKTHYEEMRENFFDRKTMLREKQIFLFGHCEATLALIDLLLENDISPVAILDNNEKKYGLAYKGIPVVSPVAIMEAVQKDISILIVSRFYEAMNAQVRALGFRGEVIKLIDYNTFAEYSLSVDTRERKHRRIMHGIELLDRLKEKYKEALVVFCPFNALGDIYFTMSYLSAFLEKRGVIDVAVCVSSKACAKVVSLFGIEKKEVLEQKELDAVIQAVIYIEDERCFIAHQDRPYVVNLHKMLKVKKIPLEKIYCCGVFGLEENTKPVLPDKWNQWGRIGEIHEGRAVVISPYAKSVIALPEYIWTEIIMDYKNQGYQVFTNVAGDEKALPGTEPIFAELCEMKSILERAGTFIGIRSGLCDVIRTAECKKIALYPDYDYCNTQWKAIDMYSINDFENIVVRDGDTWENLKKQIK